MSTVSQEIGAILAAVEAAIMQGASAKEIVALMYDESVIIVSEGARSAARGLEEVLPRMTEFMRDWGPHPRVVLKLCEPVLSAETLALAMVTTEIHPDRPDASVLRYSALMGWKRESGRWRVTMEMVSTGVI
jgi:ketosteroid isomerase-like protein